MGDRTAHHQWFGLDEPRHYADASEPVVDGMDRELLAVIWLEVFRRFSFEKPIRQRVQAIIGAQLVQRIESQFLACIGAPMPSYHIRVWRYPG